VTTAADPRNKIFYMRVTPDDWQMLTGLATDEQRTCSQVATVLFAAALHGYGKLPMGTSLLSYCRWLEGGKKERGDSR